MSEVPRTNAEKSLAICPLLESEVLVRLLLSHWRHPFSGDSEYRNHLLESATEVLKAAANQPAAVFIEGMPASDMNFIAAIWYVESQALDEWGADIDAQREARLQWLKVVQRAIPSCFCPQDRLL